MLDHQDGAILHIYITAGEGFWGVEDKRFTAETRRVAGATRQKPTRIPKGGSAQSAMLRVINALNAGAGLVEEAVELVERGGEGDSKALQRCA